MTHLDVDTAHQLLAGRLAPSAADLAQKHLETCRPCRDLVAREQSLLNMLDLDDQPVADPTAMDRLLDRVEAAEPGGAARQLRRKWLAGAATVLAVVALGLGVYALRPRPGRNQQTARALGISVGQQNNVVTRLDGLRALREDHWLMANFETVTALDGLIRKDRE